MTMVIERSVGVAMFFAPSLECVSLALMKQGLPLPQQPSVNGGASLFFEHLI